MKWLLLFITALCTAQSPILPFDEIGDGTVVGAYYKDLDNEFSKFTGTWKFENPSSNTSFTITFQKKESLYNPVFNYYEDALVGEYKYVENGVEIINTLNNLNTNHTGQFYYNIAGAMILDQYNSTAGNRKKVSCNFNDPEREYILISIIVEYISPQGSQPAQLKVKWMGDLSAIEEGQPDHIRVPTVEYILVKQP